MSKKQKPLFKKGDLVRHSLFRDTIGVIISKPKTIQIEAYHHHTFFEFEYAVRWIYVTNIDDEDGNCVFDTKKEKETFISKDIRESRLEFFKEDVVSHIIRLEQERINE